MKSKTARQANPIGLDLSGDGLRAVQLETLETGTRLVDAACLPEPIRSDEELKAQVGRLLRDHHFVGRDIVTALPSGLVSTHHVRLPEQSDEKLHESILAQIGGQLSYDVTTAVVRHLKVFSSGGREGQSDHIAFAAPRNVVEDHLRMAEKLGLTMVGISVLPLAVGHAFNYLGQRREENDFTFLLVHLSPRATHLVIVHEGELRFARSIPQGVHDILEAAAKVTGRSFESLREEQQLLMQQRGESILLNSRMTEPPLAPAQQSPLPYELAGPALDSYVEEIVSCLCYFASTVSPQGVNKAIFVGPQADDYGFCQMLASRCGLPAQIGDPLAGIHLGEPAESTPTTERRPEPDLAVAVGLSLFGAEVN